jgi:tetratricopeptide (TPR) repeat protein
MIRKPLFACLAIGVCLVLPMHASAQRASDPRVLMDRGVAALKEERFGDAYDAFTAATKSAPKDPNLWYGAGVAAFKLGRYDDAETSFERAVKLDPRFAAAYEWMGAAQHQMGHVKDAIASYEAALKLTPDSKELQDALAQWRREGQIEERYYESRGAHFSVRFEGPSDDALARRIVERLEAAYWRIGGVLTTYPPQPITAVLYTTQQFQDITRSPSWSAGMYDGRIHVPIRGAEDHLNDLDRVLGHEFVHAVVRMIGGANVPTWLNEGLAVALEPRGREDAAKTLTRYDGRLPLTSLHESFRTVPDEYVSLAYAQSAAAVGRLLDLRGAAAIVILLQDLGRGAPFESAFWQRMGMPYADFQKMVTR